MLDSPFLKVSNAKWYIIFLVISIIFIIISHIWDYDILSILENISYSIIAATIMAYIIDYNNLKQKEEERNKFKTAYFSKINNQLSSVIGHLLWFEDNLNNDDIDWGLNPNSYLEINFFVFASKIAAPYEISFNEAVTRLENLGKKYSLENIGGISNIERYRVNKMFQISSVEHVNLLNEINENDKLILEIGGYINIGDLDDLIRDISLCIYIMSKNKNYYVAISKLISVVKTFRKVGNYNNDIKVNMNEKGVSLTELIAKL